jgi:hypothetical protein
MNALNPPELGTLPLTVPVSFTSPYAVTHLSDAELLTGTRGLVARSNHHLAALLAHLAEVEARGIHRLRACSSLYTYCLYELRFSEDSAYRHARAAKLARQFPVLFERIAAGEIHLSGVLLLGPHLTEDNHRELLARAKHRSKREIAKLIRVLDPLPEVPSRIEPLGPSTSARPLTGGSWRNFMESLNPVRELESGQRPRDWIDLPVGAVPGPSGAMALHEQFGADDAPDVAECNEPVVTRTCAGKPAFTSGLATQRFGVQFTASQEYVDLVQRAFDLLSHQDPSRSLSELHLRAMRLLVRDLEWCKYGITESPLGLAGEAEVIVEGRSPAPSAARKTRMQGAGDDLGELPAEEFKAAAGASRRNGRSTNAAHTDPRQCGRHVLAEDQTAAVSMSRRDESADAVAQTDPRRRGRHVLAEDQTAATNTSRRRESPDPAADTDPRRRGRYVPVATRRKIHERDGGRCGYVAADGQRCRETSWLEIHHLEPHARGGPSTLDNLGLRCRAHNALAAEQDFGHDHMARRSGR